MTRGNAVAIVFYYRKTARYSFNVLTGALEDRLPPEAPISLYFPNTRDEFHQTLREAASTHRTVLACWSFFSMEFLENIAELQDSRNAAPSGKIMHLAGGPHVTAETRETLRAGWDYAAVGEGEKIILDVIDGLLNGRDLKAIKGLAYLEGEQYCSNGAGERMVLDDYPPFAVKHRRFNPIEITRGCIYACRFCQTSYMFKARFRHRSVDNICRYVDALKQRGMKAMRFITPTCLSYGSQDHNVNLPAIEELLRRVRETLGEGYGDIFFGSFPSECRPEHVTPEALQVLKRYVTNGNIIIGAQSGSERMLERSMRGHDAESVRRACRVALEHGFQPNVDFIFGIPGETEEDRRLSLVLARELAALGARIHGHTFMPLPGTPFRNQPPGNVPPDYLVEFERLTSHGRFYGQWKKQIEWAQQLAHQRPTR
ncbi:TIGR04013 family B12-binding domain/radical SAM domain-containing protein [Candidatus Sumerlaeota bacterium]|nr:TIGR04013 family B12-binding domain/radical SAM domain-containing protein [Candidatus Sumerlaeota bacterium]